MEMEKDDITQSKQNLPNSQKEQLSIPNQETNIENNLNSEPIEININKPFMYIIRDKETNEMWFIGTVYKPNLWENDKADYDYR